jgi:hypothetical protein
MQKSSGEWGGKPQGIEADVGVWVIVMRDARSLMHHSLDWAPESRTSDSVPKFGATAFLTWHIVAQPIPSLTLASVGENTEIINGCLFQTRDFCGL